MTDSPLIQSEAASEFIRLGAQPVRPDRPGGDPPDQDDGFELLRDQIRGDVAGGQRPPDWDFIRQQATRLLRDVGKDTRVAIYLAIALGKQRGWNGFTEGLGMLSSMYEQHWPSIWPDPQRRGRAHWEALQYLVDSMKALEAPKGPEAILLAEAMSRLADTIEQRLDPLDPEQRQRSVAGLRRLAGEARRGAVAAAPPQNTEAASTPSASRHVASATSAQGVKRAVDNPSEARRSLPALRRDMLQVARLLNEADPLQSEPYALLRGNAWANAEAIEISPDGSLAMPGPDPAEATLATSLESPSDRDIAAAERRVAIQPYWLDLSVHVADLLASRGSPAANAHRVVIASIQALLQRRPELRDARFARGVPLLTRPLATAADQGASSGGTAPSSCPSTQSEKRQIDDDLGSVAQVRAGRDRFLRILKSLSNMDLRHSGSLPLYQSLFEMAKEVNLESWEPELAAQLYEPLLKVRLDGGWGELRLSARAGLARVAPDRLVD
ncbi:MAG: hypothetical protein EA376_01855 [Phycisphaeraceae bacterium]|nr:MAG: hypothetical protein EA376_01855 [Phycisphaeraceae bacterium]